MCKCKKSDTKNQIIHLFPESKNYLACQCGADKDLFTRLVGWIALDQIQNVDYFIAVTIHGFIRVQPVFKGQAVNQSLLLLSLIKFRKP